MGHSDAFAPPRRPLAAGSFFLAAAALRSRTFFRRQPDQDQAASLAIRVLTSLRGQPPHRPCPVRRAVDPGFPSGVLELRAGKIGRPTAVRTFFEGRGEYWPYETPGLSPLRIAHQRFRSA